MNKQIARRYFSAESLAKLGPPPISEPLRTVRLHRSGVAGLRFGKMAEVPVASSQLNSKPRRNGCLTDQFQTLAHPPHSGAREPVRLPTPLSCKRPLRFQDETDNSEIARVLNPWIATARHVGKTPVFVHHDRKGGGEHGEGIAGGHALLGAVDIALELLRDTHGVANRRRIRAFPRCWRHDFVRMAG